MQENITNLHPVLYLVLNLESLPQHNRFGWSRDTTGAARFTSAGEAEAERGMVHDATGNRPARWEVWFVINEDK